MSNIRDINLQYLKEAGRFDVLIIGAGINGACLYDRLCREGYKVLLVDKGDFASGTSSQSGLMLWGGLLYLKDFDFPTVIKLCRDRDKMIAGMPEWIRPMMLRFLNSSQGGRSRLLMQSVLNFYWLVSFGHRTRPHLERHFGEEQHLIPGKVKGSSVYEEGFLNCSDGEFVLKWILPHHSADQLALNYIDIEGEYSPSENCWQFSLVDRVGRCVYRASTSYVVNCAGVWTDEVNDKFGIKTPFKHVFSKGAYLNFKKKADHDSILVFENPEHDDVLTDVPWGPVSLWGPTETAVREINEGFQINGKDIEFLLDHYRSRFNQPLDGSDVISYRCGIRPLVVKNDYKLDRHPLELSRRQEICPDDGRRWISCYGGKITGCTSISRKLEKLLSKRTACTGQVSAGKQQVKRGKDTFPGLELPVPSAKWCVENEYCCTLDDYLRRRTSISQWVHNEAMGKDGENESRLRETALALGGGDEDKADALYADYLTSKVSIFEKNFRC